MSDTRQKRLRRGGAKTVVTLSLISGALLLYEILRDNVSQAKGHWLDLQILQPVATAVLAAMATVWAAREQFAQDGLQYFARAVKKSKRLKGDRFWQIALFNRGYGALEVTQITFHIQKDARSPVQFARTAPELRSILATHGFANGQQYWIQNLVSGFGFGKDPERIYFECSPELQSLSMLDAVFEYRVALGDRYRKTVHLRPGDDAFVVILDVTDESPEASTGSNAPSAHGDPP